jgi:hypothetical protein
MDIVGQVSRQMSLVARHRGWCRHTVPPLSSGWRTLDFGASQPPVGGTFPKVTLRPLIESVGRRARNATRPRSEFTRV